MSGSQTIVPRCSKRIRIWLNSHQVIFIRRLPCASHLLPLIYFIPFNCMRQRRRNGAGQSCRGETGREGYKWQMLGTVIFEKNSKSSMALIANLGVDVKVRLPVLEPRKSEVVLKIMMVLVNSDGWQGAFNLSLECRWEAARSAATVTVWTSGSVSLERKLIWASVEDLGRTCIKSDNENQISSWVLWVDRVEYWKELSWI